MGRREKRIRRGRPASGGAGELSTPIIHHQLSFINFDGFTLIELLVVISIIAMLMAILLATLGRVRKQVRAVACQANLRQWGYVFKMYTDGNDGRWFYPGDRNNGPWWWFSETLPLWYGSPAIALCPMATKRPESPAWMWDAFTACRSGWDFGNDPAGIRVYVPFSYGYNLANLCWRRPVDPAGLWAQCWERCDVRGASNVPVFFDCAYPEVCPEDRHAPPPVPWIEVQATYPMCINRHNGGINMLFLDWSVRKVGLKELWMLKWHRGYNTAGPWTRRGGVRAEDWPQWMRRFKDY